MHVYPMREGKGCDSNSDVLRFMSERKIVVNKEWKQARPTLLSAYESCKRFLVPMPSISHGEDYELSYEWLYQFNAKFSSGTRVLSDDEARGIMYLQTSACLPLIMQGFPHKADWIFSLASQQDLPKVWSNLLTGDHWCLIQVIMKSRELLPLEKIMIQKFRSVYGVDLSTNWALVKLCHQQVEAKNRTPFRDTWSWSGHEPYGFGTVDRAVHMLIDPEEKIWDADASKWEAQCRERDMLQLALMRWKLLRAEDKTLENLIRLKNLYRAMATCVMVMPDGYMFLKGSEGYGGNLSGQFCTSPDNVDNLLSKIFYAYIRACRNLDEQPSLQRFLGQHRGLMMGDDLNLATSCNEWWRKATGVDMGLSIALILWFDFGIIFESSNFSGTPWMQSAFCSMYFHLMTQPVKHLTFKLDHDRMWCSLSEGGINHEPPEQLLRIASIRNIAWGDEIARNWLTDLYWYIRNQYGDKYATDPVWQQAVDTYKSDNSLFELFCGSQLVGKKSISTEST